MFLCNWHQAVNALSGLTPTKARCTEKTEFILSHRSKAMYVMAPIAKVCDFCLSIRWFSVYDYVKLKLTYLLISFHLLTIDHSV